VAASIRFFFLSLCSDWMWLFGTGIGGLFFDFAQVNDKDEKKRLIDGGRVRDGDGDFGKDCCLC